MNERSLSPAAASAATRDGRSIFVTAPDGLRLHVREYGSPFAAPVPVVCLPGLTRTRADFAALASVLTYGYPERRVIAIDLERRQNGDHIGQFDGNIKLVWVTAVRLASSVWLQPSTALAALTSAANCTRSSISRSVDSLRLRRFGIAWLL